MTHRTNARPARPAAAPLSPHQQAMCLPHIRRLAAEKATDADISFWLTVHIGFKVTRSQVARIRRDHGIASLYCNQPQPGAPVLTVDMRSRYAEPIRQRAREGRSDPQIARELGLSSSQVYQVRLFYGIPAAVGPRRAAAPVVMLSPAEIEAARRAATNPGVFALQLADRRAAAGQNDGFEPRRTRIVIRHGMQAHCAVCDVTVDAHSEELPDPHRRMTGRIVSGVRVNERCPGSDIPVTWSPAADAEAVMAA